MGTQIKKSTVLTFLLSMVGITAVIWGLCGCYAAFPFGYETRNDIDTTESVIVTEHKSDEFASSSVEVTSGTFPESDIDESTYTSIVITETNSASTEPESPTQGTENSIEEDTGNSSQGSEITEQNTFRLIPEAVLEGDVVPLTAQLLEGNWLDEDGVIFTIDPNEAVLTDITGTSYRISEIREDGLVLSNLDSEAYLSYLDAGYIIPAELPLPKDNYFLPMFLDECGALHYGECTVYRADSEQGENWSQEIEKQILDKQLSGSILSMRFNSDGTIEDNPDSMWEYRAGEFVIYESEEEEFREDCSIRVRRLSDKSFCLLYLFQESTMSLVVTESGATVSSPFEGDYVVWNVDTGKTYMYSIGESMMEIKEADSDSVSLQEDYLLVRQSDYFNQYAVVDTDEFFCGQGMVNLICKSRKSEGLTRLNTRQILLRRELIPAQLLLYREDIINQRYENVILPEGYVEECAGVEVNIRCDSPYWLPDVMKVEYVLPDSYKYPLTDNDTLKGVSPEIIIDTNDDSVEYTVNITIPISCFENEESLGVYRSTRLFRNLIDDSHVSIVLDGDNYVISYTESADVSLIIADNSLQKRIETYYDVKTLLSIDPSKSLWSITCNTGDVIGLVDMDYLKDSVDTETGTADFWVSTPSELATVTYYVNSLDIGEPVVQGDNVMYYVHLLNDIDLNGYEWASIGQSATNREVNGVDYSHCFQGIFFGNGYAIQNLHLTNDNTSFMSGSRFTTIIGLTLEEPVLSSGFGSIMLDNKVDNCEVYASKIVIDSKYSSKYTFGYDDNESVTYNDCFYYSYDSSSNLLKPLKLDYLNSGYSIGIGNWVKDYYSLGDSNYTYAASEEYASFIQNPELFKNCTYYLETVAPELIVEEPVSFYTLCGSKK